MVTSIGAPPQKRSQRSTCDLWPCQPFNQMPSCLNPFPWIDAAAKSSRPPVRAQIIFDGAFPTDPSHYFVFSLTHE